MEDINERIPLLLENIKEKNPLTLCITNSVTINDCANAILAIGASPIMTEDIREIEEIEKIANVLVINIGTINEIQEELIYNACKYANENNIPIIFDPVGVGMSKLRNEITLNLIENYKLSAIKGNMSEIKKIYNLIFNNPNHNNNSIDANLNDLTTEKTLKDNSKLVKKLSKKLKTIVIASGPIDLISDGEITIGIKNGDEMMTLVTGSGCMLSAICGSCIGANNPLEGSVLACLMMSIAGEYAKDYVNNENLGNGTFRVVLIDYLNKLTEKDLIEKSDIVIL